jgi:hypothetical protein
MPQFMLLLRGSGNWASKSPAQIQDGMQEYLGWVEALREAGDITGDELEEACRMVGPPPEFQVAEGHGQEGKEAIRAYYFLTASSLDDAVGIAKSCPHLAFGGRIEVRPIVEDPT